jgi:hypothetical protein
MGPFLLSHFMQQQQQLQLMAAQGKQAMREAEILNQRREMLASAQQYAIQLVQESSSNPQRTFGSLQLFAKNLVYDSVVPDSFEDPLEKEEVVVLWRKLSNLFDKCKSSMTAGQLGQCQECLNAFGSEYFLQKVAGRLSAYTMYQQIKPRWEDAWRLSRHLAYYQKICWVVVITLILGFMGIIFYLMYSGSGGIDPVTVVLAVLLFVSVGIGYWIYAGSNRANRRI